MVQFSHLGGPSEVSSVLGILKTQLLRSFKLLVSSWTSLIRMFVYLIAPLVLIWLLASLQLDFACGSLQPPWFPSKLTLVFLLCPHGLGCGFDWCG